MSKESILKTRIREIVKEVLEENANPETFQFAGAKRKMRYVDFVKVWRDKNDPAMPWSQAMSEAKEPYKEFKAGGPFLCAGKKMKKKRPRKRVKKGGCLEEDLIEMLEDHLQS